jgi:PAS domain S-box-containing protein
VLARKQRYSMFVLIVEDDLNTSIIISKVLGKIGFENYVVHNVTDAIQYIKLNDVDIMILDYILEKEKATDLLDKCKSENIDTPPFIVATGFGDESLAVEMMKRGARDYLVKSVNFVHFLPTIVKRVSREIKIEREYKKAKIKLQKSETLNNHILESLDEVIHLVDNTLKIILLNKKAKNWCKSNGVNFDVIGQSLLEAFPFLSNEIIEKYNDVIKTGERFHSNGKHKIGNKIFYTETRLIPFIQNNEVKGVITIVKDITNQELAQNEIEEKKRLLDDTQKLSKVGGWKYDVKTQIMFWTNETFRIHGIDQNILSGKGQEFINSSIKCYHKEFQGEIRKKFDECVRLGHEYDIECPFTKYTGEKIWIRTVGKPIIVDGKITQVVGNLIDITDRKLEEEIQKAQLRLIKFSETNDIKNVLQQFLDEVERLTWSEIGFYHFINDDQNTIQLQTWSTRTMENFCTITDHPTHYPIEKAGVWIDCVHQRKPVIHNDYETLPNKKGMPQGHAIVDRELVVPVIRNDKIVAVLGIGNKSSDYDEKDVATVQKFAELAWETVEKKRYEEKLQQSEHRLRTIIDAVPSMIYVKNREGRFLAANQAVADSLNKPLSEVIGKLHADLHTNEEELHLMLQSDMQVFETGEPVEILEELLHDNKNKHYWAHTIKIPYNDSSFSEPAILGVTIDISKLKKAEESTKQSEKKYRTLVKNIPGITYRCLMDDNWTMLYFSQKSLEILGYPSSDFINNGKRSYESIIYPEDKDHVRIRVEKGIESDQIYSIEYRVVSADGSIKWVHEKGQGIRDDSGKLLYLDGFIMDINDRKKAEAERINLEKKLQRTQKLETIGTLAGGIAHDFNNMLTPIMGYSDLALTKIPSYNPLYDDLQNILQASKRAKDLVQQILTFSRQVETEHQPLKLQIIIKEAIKLLRPTIPSSIKINLKLNSDSSFIKADPSQMHQVIVNLCTNSFQAMEQTGGELTIELSDCQVDNTTNGLHKNLQYGRYVMMVISDTGKGMDQLTLNRVFEPFFTTKTVDKGTGMGLSVVHGIVHEHNGEIFVFSELDKGTSFHIYIPAITSPVSLPVGNNSNIPHGSEYILVVDDEDFITKMTKRMLEGIGYKIDTLNSSREALDIILKNPDKYDLLITDLTMPDMTGIELIRKIRNSKNDIPILMMTGYGDMISDLEKENSKISKLISKPIIYNDFAIAIRNTLDK